MAHAMTRRTDFNPYVHGARGLFAALVFVFHVANSGLPTFAPWRTGPLFDATMSLQFGVELFFGISGFVIVGALGRAPSIRAFLWDRATRIYPVLWVSLVAITLAAALAGRWRPPLGQWLLNFAAPPPFIHVGQINPAAWSLGYELTFYALAAFVWWLRPRAPSAWRPAAYVIGAIMVVLFPRAILIPAGIFIALGLGQRASWWRWSAVPELWLVLFLALWGGIALSEGEIQTLNPLDLPVERWSVLPVMLLAGLCGTLALAGIAGGRGLIAPILASPPMRWLGTVSYSFYLWHPVVMAVVKAAMLKAGAPALLGSWSQTVFGLASLPGALIVASLSQRWLEFGLTRWLRRHGPREDHGRAPITVRTGPNHTEPRP